jgi:hypothetical protein
MIASVSDSCSGQVELSSEIGGPERIRTSTAMRRFYRALGSLMPSRPIGLVLLQGFEP